MNIMLFIFGVVVGVCSYIIVSNFRSAHGEFKIEPYKNEDDLELYSINIAVPPNQKLLKKNKIILFKK